MNEEPKTVADELMKEITRVRDRVLPAYNYVGGPAAIAAQMMRGSLDRATRALAEGDAIQCIKSLEDLRGYSV